MNEFALIDRLLSHQTLTRDDVVVGVGDDAAVTSAIYQDAQKQVITTDTLVLERHFLAIMTPHQIGYRALAVNLSDLAAMGATPTWLLCSLNLPKTYANATFIDGFAEGFFALAKQHNAMLIGGNMTQSSELAISITAMGETPTPLLRHGAQAGDYIFVTGTLGGAAAGLAQLKADTKQDSSAPIDWDAPLIQRYVSPTPRVALAAKIKTYTNALIDCSDGFAQDLAQLLQQSQISASIDASLLPRPDELTSMAPEQQLDYVLNGGDDYELIGTCSPAQFADIEAAAQSEGTPISVVGEILAPLTTRTSEAPRITWHNTHDVPLSGFDHFA